MILFLISKPPYGFHLTQSEKQSLCIHPKGPTAKSFSEAAEMPKHLIEFSEFLTKRKEEMILVHEESGGKSYWLFVFMIKEASSCL